MKKYICIHGHFYQPPRENPWLERVELQDSAYPYHDWNERITEECYGPNTAARILGESGKIVNIINNYSRLSYNFGPTLLSWMEAERPDAYRAVISADAKSRERFRGHGGALAQVYNHVIMPLASRRDKKSQVLWGIADFKKRFERQPEGMWLAETAADTETLEVLAEYGIRFTILSPYQAARFRKIGTDEWIDVRGGRIDPRRPYLCSLPSGRKISIFYYDGPVSQEIAFGGLLKSGVDFANRLLGIFSDSEEETQLAHIATDGETYGHHHKHGEMALSYCLEHIGDLEEVSLTVYGEFLELNPPQYETQIIENSSWSCSHGVERWKADCGCSSGMNPGWNQQWRRPLRESLDWLRSMVDPLYERYGGEFFKDPWKARNDYIDVILNRSEEAVHAFLKKQQRREILYSESADALKLLELQRHAMLMYTSCGWFFDEVTGIETMQVIQYAARVIQLARSLGMTGLEPEFLERIKKAESNLPEHKNAAEAYRKYVKPTEIDLSRVASHFAVSALFEDYPESMRIGCYEIQKKAYELFEAGKQRLSVGRLDVRSVITWEQESPSFTVLHLGDHNIIGGVRIVSDGKTFDEQKREIKEDFMRGDTPAVILKLNKFYGEDSYLLRHLFKDEKRKVMEELLALTYEELEISYRRIFQNNYTILQALKDMQNPLSKALTTPVEFVINTDLRNVFESGRINLDQLDSALEEYRRWPLELERDTITFVVSNSLSRLIKQALGVSFDRESVRLANEVFRRISVLDLDIDLYEAQNIFFSFQDKIAAGRISINREDETQFHLLGENLDMETGGKE